MYCLLYGSFENWRSHLPKERAEGDGVVVVLPEHVVDHRFGTEDPDL